MAVAEAAVLENGLQKSPSVIVVGAGPVGLLTAKRLIQAGIPTTILEAQPEIEQSPRAMVYQPIAVRELDKAGILESARQIGSSAKVVSWRKLNGEVIAVLGRPYVPDAGEGAQYETLVLGQHELSNIILQEIEKTPTLGRILFNHRVVELNQQADAVTVVVETGENKRMEFSASYLVAADGGRSTLRRLLGVSFDGFTWPQQLVATNVVYPFDKYGYDATNLICDNDHWGVITKINGADLWRVSYGEMENLTYEQMQQRQPMKYEKLFPGPRPLKYELKNFSPYRIHQRCASTFRIGRALLAGDAAHLCNPMGAMGLTGGLLDAGALADVLIATIQDPAYSNGSLLDRYAQVRRDIFLKVVDPLTQANLRRLCEGDPETLHQTDPFLKKVVESDVEEKARMRRNAPPLAIDML